MELILKLEPDRHAKLHKFIPNHASITHPIDQYHSPLRDEENNGGHWSHLQVSRFLNHNIQNCRNSMNSGGNNTCSI
ncbi:hypothetical protein H5410_033226 [Solanum commersonii]|uniref:Uncharacterized protein n=1 Tax=Solanum commersonii TaxID=4109 RepID=A0A9J5YQ56_SOLCO|nr:hypothetical protein H5410_033226 [Solanum commersonii]